MEMRVEVDKAACERMFAAAGARIMDGIGAALKESCRIVQAEARGKHKFRSRTGVLERAIDYAVSGNEGEVYINDAIAPYGVFVHEPTGTHAPADKRLPSKYYRWPDGSYAIRPVDKKSLRFIGAAGQSVFARQARHPGSPADRFLYEALDAKQAEICAVFARHMGRMFGEGGA